MSKTETAAQGFNHTDLYRLDGKIPWLRAIPYGVQHILAMFVANLAPILIVAGAAGLDSTTTGSLVQSAMLIAGIGTLVQLFPLAGRIGSGLPIVMGISFTFVTVLCGVAATYGFNAAIGAIMVGGLIEGVLGLFAKYWRWLISPIVAAVVVTSIGFSLLSVGAASFGGGSGSPDFGSPQNIALGSIALISCLVFQIMAKGKTKQLSVLFGLVIGYVAALFMGMVDFSGFASAKPVSIPEFMPFAPEFHPSAILAVTLIFLVSATETIGDTSTLAMVGLGRDVREKELSGSIACDGFVSSVSACFGCLPITSFSQNVGLVAMTKVVNRRAIATGGHHHDSCGVSAGHQRGVFLVARCRAWRLHHYDVRQYHCERFPDDRPCRFYATQYSYCGAVAFYWHRIHPGVGDFRFVARNAAERICRQLRGRGVLGGGYREPRVAERHFRRWRRG